MQLSIYISSYLNDHPGFKNWGTCTSAYGYKTQLPEYLNIELNPKTELDTMKPTCICQIEHAYDVMSRLYQNDVTNEYTHVTLYVSDKYAVNGIKKLLDAILVLHSPMALAAEKNIHNPTPRKVLRKLIDDGLILDYGLINDEDGFYETRLETILTHVKTQKMRHTTIKVLRWTKQKDIFSKKQESALKGESALEIQQAGENNNLLYRAVNRLTKRQFVTSTLEKFPNSNVKDIVKCYNDFVYAKKIAWRNK